MEIEIFVHGRWAVDRIAFDLVLLWNAVARASASILSFASAESFP